MAKTGAAPTNNEMKMKKLKQQIFVGVVIAAIVVSLSLVLLKFLFDLWTYNGRVQSAQRETRSTLENNLETYEDLSDWYQILQSADGSIDDPDPEVVLVALPEEYDFPALASSVKKLADRSGVELTGFGGEDEEGNVPGPSPQPDPYEIEISVEVNGDYDDISEFVNVLDSSIRPFEVISMELSGSDESLNADIIMKTYFQPRQNLDYPERRIE